MADAANLMDLAARISADTSQSDKALTDTQKRVLELAEQFKKTERVVDSSSKKMGQSAKEYAKQVKAQTKAVEDSAKAVNRDLGGAVSAISPRLGALAGAGGPITLVAIGMAAIAAASVGAIAGIYKLATAAASSVDKIGDMADKVNFSVRTLSGLETAAEASGGSLEGLSTALGIFDKNIEAAAQGDKRLATLFKGLEIDATNNERAFRQVAEILVKLGGTAQQTALAMELFGRSGKDVLGIIKETGGNVEEFIKRAEKMGIVIGEDAVKAADAFDRQMVQLKAQISAVGRHLGMEFVPMVQLAAKNMSTWLTGNQVEIRKTIVEIVELTKAITKLASFIMSITPLVFVVKTVWQISKLIPETASAESINQQRERNTFITDPNTGRRIYAGRAPFDVEGEFAVPGGAGSSSVGAGPPSTTRTNALADQVRALLARGGGGGGGTAARKDILEGLKTALMGLQTEYRKYSVEILGSASATAEAVEKEKLLTSIMSSLKNTVKAGISEIKDVDEALNRAIGSLPKKSQEAARALVDQSLAQFRSNQELKRAGELNKKAEELSQSWRQELDRARGGVDEYAIAIMDLEKEFTKYGLTLDKGTKAELEQLVAMRKELDLVLSLTRARRILDITRERFATKAARERPDWIDLGGGSFFGGQTALGERPRIATNMERTLREHLEKHREQMRALASDIAYSLDNAVYEGFRSGAVRGVAALGLSLLDMLHNIFFKQFEEGLANLLSGAGKGGGGNWLSKILNFVPALFGGGGGGGSPGSLGSAAGAFAGGFQSGGTIPMGMWGKVHEGESVLATPRGAKVVSNREGGVTGDVHNHYWTVITKDAESFTRRDSDTQIKRKMERVMRKR